jgi:hypothetical protein
VSRPLRELTAHFGNGVQTGADAIYLFDAATAAELRLEPPGLAPFLRGRDVRRYSVARGRTSVVFPYRAQDNRFVPVDESELAGWPSMSAYLTGHRERLSSRQWFGKTATELSGAWYGLMYVDHPAAFRSRHLLTPSLANRASFAIDEGSLFATGTAGVVSVVPREEITESIEYLLAVLNSTLLTYYAVAHSPIFQGGYHKFSKGYIEDLPIRRIDPGVPADIAIHADLCTLALERMRIEGDSDSATTPHDKLTRLRRASETEAAIDALVFSLYGFSSAEAEKIQAVERDRLAATTKRVGIENSDLITPRRRSTRGSARRADPVGERRAD